MKRHKVLHVCTKKIAVDRMYQHRGIRRSKTFIIHLTVFKPTCTCTEQLFKVLTLKNLTAVSKTTQPVTIPSSCSSTPVHSHDRTVRGADMVDILRAVYDVGNPEAEEDRPEKQPSDAANETGN